MRDNKDGIPKWIEDEQAILSCKYTNETAFQSTSVSYSNLVPNGRKLHWNDFNCEWSGHCVPVRCYQKGSTVYLPRWLSSRAGTALFKKELVQKYLWRHSEKACIPDALLKLNIWWRRWKYSIKLVNGSVNLPVGNIIHSLFPIQEVRSGKSSFVG